MNWILYGTNDVRINRVLYPEDNSLWPYYALLVELTGGKQCNVTERRF